MAVTPFVRAPNLSSTIVLHRMRVKRGIYEKRREAIKRESENLARKAASARGRSGDDLDDRLRSLDLEDQRIAGFQVDLEALFRIEEAGIEQRSGRPMVSKSETGSEDGRVSHSGGAAAPVAAGAGAAVDRYDQTLCLFKASKAPILGDPTAKPIGELDGVDHLLAGLISLVDVPGLAHMALLMERRQEVFGISSQGVPPEALGLAAAEAFAEHVFSADAYSTILDQASVSEFLTDVARSASKRPT